MSLNKHKQKLSKFVHKCLSKLHDKPLASPTDEEKALVRELRATFRDFRPTDPNDCCESRKEWLNNANCLRKLVLNGDPREFLRWHVISGTMFVKYSSYVEPELKYLKNRPDWASRWKEAIKECSVGHPLPYYRYPQSSANLIHHAYHWAIFEDKTGIGVDGLKFIFEFGGGYGSMCRLLYNLGFKGKYILFDLPAFSALQQFFLKSAGIMVHPFDSFKNERNGAICISDLDQLKQILLPRTEASSSMFIATWSVSEAPLSTRNAVLALLASSKQFLITYQDQFREINNVEFFEKWKANREDIDWYEWEIEHMPGNRYLVGKIREH